jgi:hypothetical protein
MCGRVLGGAAGFLGAVLRWGMGGRAQGFEGDDHGGVQPAFGAVFLVADTLIRPWAAAEPGRLDDVSAVQAQPPSMPFPQGSRGPE